jgi:glutathione peroxidase
VAKNLHELSYVGNNGQSVSLSDFAGKPVLIVNTASKCGLTPQYEGLQQLHDKYAERGLVVIGFPCDQFANQEPGDDSDIEAFCQMNYGVSFRLAKKSDVNGPNTNPVFDFLKKQTRSLFGSRIKWNFTKFLVAPDGITVKRYAPTVVPEKLSDDIERLLG